MPGETLKSSPAENDRVSGAVTAVRPDSSPAVADEPDVDEFGLPVRKPKRQPPVQEHQSDDPDDVSDTEAFVDAPSGPVAEQTGEPDKGIQAKEPLTLDTSPQSADARHDDSGKRTPAAGDSDSKGTNGEHDRPRTPTMQKHDNADAEKATSPKSTRSPASAGNSVRHSVTVASEWSHMQLAPQLEKEEAEDEGEWQAMPAYAPFDIYDDNNKLIAKEAHDYDDDMVQYGALGGAGKGYTRLQLDEDAQSTTSMDDNTAYLFKDGAKGTTVTEDDEEIRDALGQMQATKELLTEGQRIAYVGIVRLTMIEMLNDLEKLEKNKQTKKAVQFAAASLQMWSQKMMLRLYAHMEIGADEQVMIEQLTSHGVQASDLKPALMINAKIKRPDAEGSDKKHEKDQVDADSSKSASSTPRRSESSHFSIPSPFGKRTSVSSSGLKSPGIDSQSKSPFPSPALRSPSVTGEPLPYDEHIPKSPSPQSTDIKPLSEVEDTKDLDIDIRWTVLCDFFLILIADATYDARSRRLLERVAQHLEVSWLDICRFEKRVTDALEMQEAADKENWNEEEHLEARRKQARKKRLMVMGLATVGGSLVIGLSAGLLAPFIGAGLAAGFTTIGVAGTSGFLAGAGGAAIVTTTGIVTGGTIGVRAADRRTGAVKTFEYRPLHNNKRVNLIVTIAGWMNGKVDDVRLPFSTVDPIMGDIYSIHWEPEMLQSMGQTISILATEALTQTLQQVLGSTILITLMAALQVPILLTKLSYLIDNPWNVSLARADLAGLILADSLIDRNLGSRPITLVGFSLGARVIFSCLKELAKKGRPGLVQNVYIFGAPVIANKNEFTKCRSVVSGRFLNAYSRNDWILAYLFRITGGGIAKVAGLTPVDDVPDIENVNVTEWVPGHMSYRAAMPRLLREVGWEVTSDEFTEIEDPDPENHEKRQRELINEIEEARKQLDEKQANKKQSKFAFWRKKKTEKKEWEVYEGDAITEEPELTQGQLEKRAEGVLFDIDAIRAEVKELTGHEIQVKQLESTLPPMKITIDSNGNTPEPTPLPLRATRSQNDVTAPSPALSMPSATHKSTFDYSDHFPYENESGEITMSFDLPTSDVSRRSPMPSERPPLKQHSTAPVDMRADHNAWADEYDDFGQGKEIKMTFA
ncbi:uncharacterized protein PV09_04969 [Verruconis gallopava]|uniref:DUF726-domain-containing protein n=1 Tax=Verruconis gallopava TaxID=253628 RepID=A0A0D1YU17_9PEZI|nr:uncharacterized protein PV09_04969 [Verruconis gallopava]KIW04162.1 hypothetical protein PV09_04969 [Verruconis gallopava]